VDHFRSKLRHTGHVPICKFASTFSNCTPLFSSFDFRKCTKTAFFCFPSLYWTHQLMVQLWGPWESPRRLKCWRTCVQWGPWLKVGLAGHGDHAPKKEENGIASRDFWEQVFSISGSSHVCKMPLWLGSWS